MSIRYAHTNIISENWRELARFYEEVFDCVPIPPQRSLAGKWLDDGTGIKNAALEGMHLRLPGHGDNGPTLEIFQYARMQDKPKPAADRKGLGHLAFAVDDVERTLAELIARGGGTLGRPVKREVADVGALEFVYATDPEGNIIELQKWS